MTAQDDSMGDFFCAGWRTAELCSLRALIHPNRGALLCANRSAVN